MHTSAIPVFISYAQEDKKYLEQLLLNLKPYVRDKTIVVWTDKNIVAGEKWDQVIKSQLSEARIVVYLLSPNFFASDYIQDVEIADTLRQSFGNPKAIVPILIRPIDKYIQIFKEFQIIPSEDTAVTEWTNTDKAWQAILARLNEVFYKLSSEGSLKDANPVTDSGVEKILSLTRKQTSSKIVTWMFVFLITMCVVLFGTGVIMRDTFYIWTSLAGIGAGLFGYYLIKKR